jgi:hypothetical protein
MRLSRVALLVILLALSLTSVAQVRDVYQLNYFDNLAATPTGDQNVRIVNPGVQGTPISPDQGTVCANMYVFDANQEMSECCSCPITANGLLTLSLSRNLTNNTLQNIDLTRGVVKIVSSRQAICDATSPLPAPNLRAFGTHINAGTVTETGFQTADLQPDELNFLGQTCSFTQYLGSGRGVCDCTDFGAGDTAVLTFLLLLTLRFACGVFRRQVAFRRV